MDKGSGAMRLVGLLSGLSRLADLGFGIPAGEALRSAALAVVLGRSLDLPDDDIRAGMYAGLLHHVGCTGYAHEAARLVGDELAMYSLTAQTDMADPKELFTTFLPGFTRGRRPLERASLSFTILARGQRIATESTTAACEVGRDAARRLGLPAEVSDSVYRSYECWNGKGIPGDRKGEDIPMGARLAMLTSTAALLGTTADLARVVEVVRSGSGKLFDPQLAGFFADRAGALLAEIDTADPQQILADAEPTPPITVPDSRLVEVATVFGDLADLKTPFTHGHARGVASLARDAGERLGLTGSDLDDLEVAALLHDLGRVAISSAVWDKPGSLNANEWEQVRLHAYHSERILVGSERLAPLAELVGMHHERCDASGYHRGCGHTDLPLAARILAVADVYQAMTHRRPHRPPLSPEQAEAQLSAEVRAGSLDAEAVAAVLAAAGHEASSHAPRRVLPAGLTDREVQVLGLVADGCSNRQVAEKLVISRRTAEHHVQHIYTKIGVSSRAAAALFAMEHDLLAPR